VYNAVGIWYTFTNHNCEMVELRQEDVGVELCGWGRDCHSCVWSFGILGVSLCCKAITTYPGGGQVTRSPC